MKIAKFVAIGKARNGVNLRLFPVDEALLTDVAVPHHRPEIRALFVR